jgi:hypothetical protein
MGSVPVCHCTKAKIIMNVERKSHSETKRREKAYRSLVCTRLPFFFFSQEKLLMLKLAKEQGAPSLLIVPFFVAARSNACETFLFEETYSFIIFKDSFILHYKERIPAR